MNPAMLNINQIDGLKELPTRMKTIKVGVRAWDSLKSMKKENETFNDVINGLLNERTVFAGNDNIKAIKYKRITHFADMGDLGFEYEYNDCKGNKSDFVLDVKIKKVFYGRKTYSPSQFFGVDNEHKHYYLKFLGLYLLAILLALEKEFRVPFVKFDVDSLVNWKKLYLDYSLSEESFKEDIEEPLRLSEDEKPSHEWQMKIKNSVINNVASLK